jgi:hypothetical protein
MSIVKNPEDPFSNRILSEIFKIDSSDPDRLISRENSQLEFKETFSWNNQKARYGKIGSSFANKNGGYLVFGIKNKPRIVIGMQDTQFEEIDPSHISSFFSSTFSPEVEWKHYIHILNNKKIGVLYFSESKNKPVVCTKSVSGELLDGDIYYRYSGQSQKIKYSELTILLNELKQKERDNFQKLLANISKIGVNNSAVLDLQTGNVVGSKEKMFVIDEKLLPKLRIIQEGTFSENSGEPTLKLMGNLIPTNSGLIQPIREVKIKMPVRIGTPDIIFAFLNQENVEYPLEYIKGIALEISGILPVYYFMHLGNLSRKQTIDLLNGVYSRSHARTKLIERLNSNDGYFTKLKITGTPEYLKKIQYRNLIVNRQPINDLQLGDVRKFCEVIQTLSKKEVYPNYLLPILKLVFNKFFMEREHNVSTDIRKAICHVDYVLFNEEIS